jgi:hypothetical protein
MSIKILKAEPIKKKIGRPFQEVKRDVVHTFKITPNESLKLNEMALKKGVRVSEFIRQKLFK